MLNKDEQIMKNKLRKFTVNNKKYIWSVIPNDDRQESENQLKIWKDKKLIIDEMVDGNITPILVKNKISDYEFYTV
jgi:hypothetical protein